MSAHVVYRAFDSDGRLLYVGCTNNIENRWRQHAADSVWFPHMADLQTDGPFDALTALRLEAQAIRAEHPIFNTTSEEQGELNSRTSFIKRLLVTPTGSYALDPASRRDAERVADAQFPCAPTKSFILARYLNDTGRWAA